MEIKCYHISASEVGTVINTYKSNNIYKLFQFSRWLLYDKLKDYIDRKYAK